MVPSATLFFCVCVVAVYSIDGEESRRFKRDVVSGLVSFPRIGRSDHLWKIGSQEVKRQSLVSFPRTGKRGIADGTDPEQLPEIVWLGPERRDIGDGKMWALVQVKRNERAGHSIWEEGDDSRLNRLRLDMPTLMGRPGREVYLRRSSGESTEEAG